MKITRQSAGRYEVLLNDGRKFSLFRNEELDGQQWMYYNVNDPNEACDPQWTKGDCVGFLTIKESKGL